MPQAFAPDCAVALPAAAARHVQVLRLQPGETVLLFNGNDDAEWPAEIVRIGRNAVDVRVGAALPVERELPWAVTLAVGVPANDRMDALVEKAGELGAHAIQPLVCERSVLRLSGERAEARRRHWSGVAAAASEQCGRARVTGIRPLRSFAAWLDTDADAGPGAALKVVLSLDPEAIGAAGACDELAGAGRGAAIVILSGPEGGLSGAEEAAAVASGFRRVSLGPRVLRADTAPLALLAALGIQPGASSPANDLSADAGRARRPRRDEAPAQAPGGRVQRRADPATKLEPEQPALDRPVPHRHAARLLQPHRARQAHVGAQDPRGPAGRVRRVGVLPVRGQAREEVARGFAVAARLVAAALGRGGLAARPRSARRRAG